MFCIEKYRNGYPKRREALKIKGFLVQRLHCRDCSGKIFHLFLIDIFRYFSMYWRFHHFLKSLKKS